MTPAGLRGILERMEAEGRARLEDFPGQIEVRPALDMRYGEQIYEITVPIDDVDLNAPDLIEQVLQRFHKRHEELYSYNAPGQAVVIVNARMAVVGKLPELHAAPLEPSAAGPVESTTRRVFLGAWTDVPVYKLDSLAPGTRVEGPAIFESPTTTVLIRDNEWASVTPHGWLDIALP